VTDLGESRSQLNLLDITFAAPVAQWWRFVLMTFRFESCSGLELGSGSGLLLVETKNFHCLKYHFIKPVPSRLTELPHMVTDLPHHYFCENQIFHTYHGYIYCIYCQF
jgi:hypothetical protein